MSILKTVGIELLQPNPYRLVNNYPYIEEKIETLIRSINDVGFWEGVIARKNPKGNGYQIAFGHHRIEAARRAGIDRVPIIQRDLTDEQMIQLMGRENGEDYKADFLTMLNTWEGAVKFAGDRRQEDIEIAALLGWIELNKGRRAMNRVSRACANAYELISDGHMNPEDFAGLSVRAVSDLVARTKKHIKTAEASVTATPKAKEKAVEKVAKGARIAARKVREGAVAPKDIQKTVSQEARKTSAYFSKTIPLFEELSKSMCNQLDKVLDSDSQSEKINEVLKNIQYIQLDSDFSRVDAIRYALSRLSERASDYAKKLEKKKETVLSKRHEGVQLKSLPGGKQ